MANDADDPAASLDTAVPVLTAQVRPRRADGPTQLGSFDFEAMKGEHVEVRASGFRYTGTLVGADEQELYLRGLTRWWVLPLDRVTAVRPLSVPPHEARKARRRGPIPGDPDEGAAGPDDAGPSSGDDA